MNVRAEIETLGDEIREAQEQAERGELTPEERIKKADRLQGRLALVKGQIRTEELVEFGRSVLDDLDRL